MGESMSFNLWIIQRSFWENCNEKSFVFIFEFFLNLHFTWNRNLWLCLCSLIISSYLSIHRLLSPMKRKKKHFTDCFLSHVNYAFTFVIECFLRTFKIHFKNLIWVCSFVNLFSLTKSCSSVCLNGMKIKVSIYGY